MALQEKIINDADKLQKAMILLVHANNEPIKGKIKLQKIMFLLSDNLDEIKKQSSYADNMPYSETVDKEMRYLNDAGVFIIDDSRIELSKEGKKIAKQLEKQEENLMKLLCNYKDFLNKLNTEEILTYIYAAYPNMAGKSAEYDKLKPHMEDHIFAMIKKEKISAQRAAELLHKPHDYVINQMKRKNIPILVNNREIH